MPGMEEAHRAAEAANYGAMNAVGAGAGADGLREPLGNFIKWSATQNLGGKRTAKVQEIIAKAKPIIERKAKDIYQEVLPGLLKGREDGFDHKAVIDALDLDKEIDSLANIEAVKNAINSQDKGTKYSDEQTKGLLNSLKGATTQKFNEFFEELAQEYYKNSLVDPLSKVNQFLDAFTAAIAGPQSLLGHAFGALYRNAKANKLGSISKNKIEELEGKYKDNGLDGAGSVEFSAAQKRGLGDGGGAGAGLAPSPSAKRARAGVDDGGGAVLAAAAADTEIHSPQPPAVQAPVAAASAAAAGLLDGVIGRDADGVFDASGSV